MERDKERKVLRNQNYFSLPNFTIIYTECDDHCTLRCNWRSSNLYCIGVKMIADFILEGAQKLCPDLKTT